MRSGWTRRWGAPVGAPELGSLHAVRDGLRHRTQAPADPAPDRQPGDAPQPRPGDALRAGRTRSTGTDAGPPSLGDSAAPEAVESSFATKVGRLNTPLDPEPVKAPTPGDPAEALDKRTRRLLGIITAVAGIVALTHQSLTAALASAHRDSALKAAYAMLTWPLPMTQPILAGVAAFVLLGIAVQTNGWRQVTARQSRLLLGFATAAVLGAGPMVLFCVLTVAIFSLVISFVLLILLILILRLILAR